MTDSKTAMATLHRVAMMTALRDNLTALIGARTALTDLHADDLVMKIDEEIGFTISDITSLRIQMTGDAQRGPA